MLRCLEVIYKLENIHDEQGNNSRQKATQFFNIAEKLTNFIYSQKTSLLLKIGTPIEVDKGDSNTTHAFYAAVKILDNNKFQVIIANAGRGYKDYHKRDSRPGTEHWYAYEYAASKPLDLTEENKEILKHYIFRLINLPYTIVSQTNAEDAQANIEQDTNTYESLMTNIYLKRKENERTFFYGYQSKKIYGLERDTINKSYQVQITGDCTVYNLQLALKAMFDMSELEYGEMIDNLILGIDNLATMLHQPHNHSIVSRDEVAGRKQGNEDSISGIMQNSFNLSRCRLIGAPVKKSELDSDIKLQQEIKSDEEDEINRLNL